MPPRNRYGLEHLFGNVAIARNIFPRLTGRVRKSNPDGSSAVGYVSTLTGKVLNIEYTRDVIGVPTTFTTTVTFAADGFQAAIDQINLLDTPNLEASDLDGFLSIRNKNPGKTHYVQINGSSTAASFLGFNQKPTPGYKSVAGEIASSPVDRVQKNPVGTSGVSRDETLEGSAINRALAGFADLMSRLMREQDREVAGYAEVPLTGANLFTLSGKVAIKFSPAVTGMRVPTNGFPDAPVPSQPGMGRLGAFFRIQTVNGEEPLLTSGDLVRVTRVLWGNPSTVTAFNDTQAFSAYTPLPSPTAFSVFGSGPGGFPSKLVKVASVAISEIQGNVVKCSGSPNFVTNALVYPGDTAKISGSSVASPFGHNGEFIVDEVLDNNTLVLRPKSKFDPLADSVAETPAGLNQGTVGMGNLEVLVGHFLNGAGLIIMTDCPSAFTSDLNGKVLRYATGVRFKEMNSDKFARPPLGGMRDLVLRLINADPFGLTAVDGASYIGAGDNADLSLTEGTVRDQLDELAAFWARMDRENTFVATQHMEGGVADDSAALTTESAAAVRKLIWVFNDGVNPKARLYFYTAGNPGFEYTFNAQWNPGIAKFVADDPLFNSQILHIDNLVLELRVRDFSELNPFDYFDATHVYISTDFFSPSSFAAWTFGVPGGLYVGDVDMYSLNPRLGFKRATNEESGFSTSAIRTKLIEDQAPLAPSIGIGAKAQMRTFMSPGAMVPGGTLGAYNCDSYEISINADWLGGTFPGQWSMDDPTQPASLLSFDPYQGLQVKVRNTDFGGGPGPWSGLFTSIFDDVLQPASQDQSIAGPTGWNSLMGFAAPSERFNNAGGATSETKRLVSMKQIPKVWGWINLDGGPVIVDGWGISSVEIAGFNLRIHFSHDLVFGGGIVFPALYQVVQGASFLRYLAYPLFISGSILDAAFTELSAGFPVRNAASIDCSLVFVVYGQYFAI